MNDDMMMKGGLERSANPSIERMLNVFDLHLFVPDEKAVSRICSSNQETYANIWLVLTIQTVIP